MDMEGPLEYKFYRKSCELSYCFSNSVCCICYLQVVMGKRVRRPSLMNQEVAKEIQSCQSDHSFLTVLAGTMCTDDFYEGTLA